LPDFGQSTFCHVALRIQKNQLTKRGHRYPALHPNLNEQAEQVRGNLRTAEPDEDLG
jgi:hypothetical protein